MMTERGLVRVVSSEFKVLSVYDILTNYYAIDEYGNIFNIKRQKLVKPHCDKDGYLHLMLCVNERLPNGNHKRKDFRVAGLVARTFLGEPPKYMIDPTVDHKDCDITNNHYSNLRWMERGENSSIRKNKGVGEFNHEAKLTYLKVHDICEMLVKGVRLTDIAQMFNVSPSTINNIKRRKSWVFVSKFFEW